jgi:hypothetical protein
LSVGIPSGIPNGARVLKKVNSFQALPSIRLTFPAITITIAITIAITITIAVTAAITVIAVTQLDR